jgi:hypothetical protein
LFDGLTVAVLGAGGTIAPPIVRDLAESPEVAALKQVVTKLAEALGEPAP